MNILVHSKTEKEEKSAESEKGPQMSTAWPNGVKLKPDRITIEVSGICYRYKEFLTWKNQNKMLCTFSPPHFAVWSKL